MNPPTLIVRRQQVTGPRAQGLALLLMCMACSNFPPGIGANADAKETEDEQRLAPVVTARSFRGAITARLSAASTIEAERQVTVHAESTGRIVDLAIEEGMHVDAGALLGRIRADLQASGLDRATTNLAKAQRDLDNLKRLVAQNAASKQDLDTAELAYQQALLDVSDRRRDLRNTKLMAPIAGVITERKVSEGAFVTSGAPVAAIVDFSSLVARVYVPEQALDRIQVGQTAEIRGKASDRRHGSGTISRIAPIVDPTTGTVKVTVALPPSTTGPGAFLPGMYAEVTMTTELHPDAILVPKRAVVHEDDQTYVFVIENDKAQRRHVELGLIDDDRAEVLNGLEAGTELVISGQAGLKDATSIQRVDNSGQPISVSPTTP